MDISLNRLTYIQVNFSHFWSNICEAHTGITEKIMCGGTLVGLDHNCDEYPDISVWKPDSAMVYTSAIFTTSHTIYEQNINIALIIIRGNQCCAMIRLVFDFLTE